MACLAAPKGFEREMDPGGILGEFRGLGLAELLPERGKSSSFRRASCGVGGVELLATSLLSYNRTFKIKKFAREVLF